MGTLNMIEDAAARRRNLPLTAVSILAIALLGCPSAIHPNSMQTRKVGYPFNGGTATDGQELSAPKWGIGLSDPIPVFAYRHAPGLPHDCVSPEVMLSNLEWMVRSWAPDNNCTATMRINAASGSRELVISCVMREIDRCMDIYTASLWIERLETSTVDYTVNAFAWAKRECEASGTSFGSNTYDAIASKQQLRLLAGKASQPITDFFSICRPPEVASIKRN